MYGTNIVHGKVIEYRNDRVITIEGDTTSTYHLRYYRMLQEDSVTPIEPQKDSAVPVKSHAGKLAFIGQLIPFNK
ncbi:hypothetical protein SY83_12600 [Paenibacillus swuensis]|uniref:Uncharacterized protein n=1 Tax=Paenibacillus swuensis TaxID=1178515 RepID=A0A172TJ94_9BACL|nr:hypothetical protein [Paenibacillus swuensis]ANE46974.1 hypothetical protein SY83_12600 [Paenibacillus swuensis]